MRRNLVIAGLALLSTMGLAQTAVRGKSAPAVAVVAQTTKTAPKLMTDSALDGTTAAGFSADVSREGVVAFQGQVPTKNGLVSAAGTLMTQSEPLTSTNMSTLTLNGNAQQNLSSLVNINAVNSKINVLLNLNVNINSTVGSVLQSNLNGKH